MAKEASGYIEGGDRVIEWEGMPKGRRWTPEGIAKANEAGDTAQATYETTLSRLRGLITQHDAIEVLARVAFAMFFRIAGLQKEPDKKGIEVWHVEILQALALSAERVDDGEGAGIDIAGFTQDSIDLLEENGQAYRHTWLRKLTADLGHNDRLELLSLLRDWTMAIRGPRHVHQTEEYARALAAAVREPFRRQHGCDPDDLITVMLGVIKTIDQRLQSHMVWLRSWMRKKTGIAMIQAFVEPFSAEVAAKVQAEVMPHRHDRRMVEAGLWSISEGRFVSMMTFTSEELVALADATSSQGLLGVIDKISLSFGEVGDSQLQHLHLDNPVRLRPFVNLDDGRYFLCNPHSLGTNLAETFQELCNGFPSTKSGVEDERAEWLERKLRSTLATFLPDAEIHRSVLWTDPADGRNYESDIITVVDKTVIVFEAKSAKIDGPARRGALNSLKGVLRKLVVDPSDQSARFKRMLQDAHGVLSFRSNDGVLEIDADMIRDIVRVNVVLDVVGPLSAHSPRLKEAGLIPETADLAPTMSIFELETVMEVLTMQVERCHYLSRREAFERQAAYVADELDLVAFYLETQFNVPSVGRDGELWLYGRSAKVAHGYSEARAAGTLSFPIRRTETWEAILRSLEDKKPAGWTRFGHRLLSFDFETQKAAERLLREGWRTVAQSVDSFFTTGITSGEAERASTISFVIGPLPDPKTFQANVARATSSALDQGGTRNLLLLYWFAPRTGEAYDFIGTMKGTGLPSRITQS
jgi:hypothetical protein